MLLINICKVYRRNIILKEIKKLYDELTDMEIAAYLYEEIMLKDLRDMTEEEVELLKIAKECEKSV